MKRLFDVVVSIVILLIILPFGIVLGIWIALESAGGVFYKQERIGKNGVPFYLFKFRSMRKDADKQGRLTIGMKDNRITKSGQFIRKYKLDEFPQFINVLKGEMSIVGPRPEVKEYVDLYTPEQAKVLDVKPGITDYASLEYFDENRILGESDDPQKTYIEEVMPAKLKLNMKYIASPTLGTDIKIMWLTFKKIVS
ncbi:Sugar transferase involved in LPS biosynthesis (colanic, teichoic acid) [Lishizhenia tianjinensis]|uniref:Sugar transferase involved in LPS biosynthesis (Colanic, teichoic acid) n=1 Tax=Lishizhenia tianjinensis TaxID=477690 RepID=A0A1I7A677_9FLAO|nr:sugar transferase [Lishizhenia tianjinensis]SFT70397.1 Sugar transferase involved in LPS biosynthesis (colanic, teichoic acid) [Lishizhenia tianjinensis]